MQGCSNGRKVLDKLCIEVAQSEEGLQLFDISGLRPLGNSIYFGWVHRDCGVFDDMAKVLQFVESESALCTLGFKLMLT